MTTSSDEHRPTTDSSEQIAAPAPTRRRYGGRQKGTPNKVTASAKAAIAEAAERMGGANRLVEWAKEAPENERAFWATIYPKLLPLQVHGDDNGGPVRHVFEWAQSNGS